MKSLRSTRSDQAVEAAWKAGIVVVVAAGNQGRRQHGEHGRLWHHQRARQRPLRDHRRRVKAEATTVRTDDLIASYSSKGPTLYDHYVKPDLIAPGNLVVSTLPAGLTLSNLYPANRVTANYFTLSGTSMATPVVSGRGGHGLSGRIRPSRPTK